MLIVGPVVYPFSSSAQVVSLGYLHTRGERSTCCWSGWSLGDPRQQEPGEQCAEETALHTCVSEGHYTTSETSIPFSHQHNSLELIPILKSSKSSCVYHTDSVYMHGNRTAVYMHGNRTAHNWDQDFLVLRFISGEG